jgi:hypothetical protein
MVSRALFYSNLSHVSVALPIKALVSSGAHGIARWLERGRDANLTLMDEAIEIRG